jgi:hypothetical protein
MPEAVAHLETLDECLKDVVQAVYAACTTAMPHLQDPDPKVADKAIEDCEEVLNMVMDGKVDDWLN